MGTEINITGNELSGKAEILGKATIEGGNNKIDVCDNTLKEESKILKNARIQNSSAKVEEEGMGEKIKENVITEVTTGAICKLGEMIFKRIFHG